MTCQIVSPLSERLRSASRPRFGDLQRDLATLSDPEPRTPPGNGEDETRGGA